jgi:protein required for attachment to host cells
MKRTCIAVVDATRARLFTYERTSELEGAREHLIEHLDLVNPARRQRPSELFSDSRPGTGRTGGLQYAFDDHREDHIDEMDAVFARLIADETERLVKSTQATHFILCASPNMLGQLRKVLTVEIPIDELARDYVKLTPAQLRDTLETHGLLPSKGPRPGMTAPPGH